MSSERRMRFAYFTQVGRRGTPDSYNVVDLAQRDASSVIVSRSEPFLGLGPGNSEKYPIIISISAISNKERRKPIAVEPQPSVSALEAVHFRIALWTA